MKGSHFLLLGIIAFAACGKPAVPAPAPANTGGVPAAAVVAAPAVATAPAVGTAMELGGTSKAGKYKITFSFNVENMGALFAPVTRVQHFDGSPLPADATVVVDATMPAHHHGMMTKPETTQLVPGQFRTQGMRLHMQGNWVFSVQVREGDQTDSLDLPFEQPPEALPADAAK